MNNNTKAYITELGKSKGKEYFQNFYTKKSKLWFEKRKLSRQLIVMINRCRANHYYLSSFLFRVGLSDTSGCECNSSEQDIDDIV